MTEIEYNRYNNILKFITDWRGYQLSSKKLTLDEFRKTTQTDEYVKIECYDTKKSVKVVIVIFDENSKYIKSSQDMKKLLNKFTEPLNIILITYDALSVYHRKAINSYKHLNIYVYRHAIFNLELPLGPLCYPHRIMTRDEVLKLTNDELCCHIINLPKIYDEDPQCIWIGAMVGDVIEIKMTSDIAGEVYQYRVVIPKNGRMMTNKEISDQIGAGVDDLDEDAEIQELREDRQAENDADELDDE